MSIGDIVIIGVLIAIGIFLLFAMFAIGIRKLSTSRLCLRIFENSAYKEIRCPRCTYGMQYLNPVTGERGPIPKSVRMVIRGRPTLGPRQANMFPCDTCGGQGYVTTRDPLVKENKGFREIT
jgi:phage FluMu protein Com